jgi:hypothetical protein
MPAAADALAVLGVERWQLAEQRIRRARLDIVLECEAQVMVGSFGGVEHLDRRDAHTGMTPRERRREPHGRESAQFGRKRPGHGPGL